jgi:ATPase subunit of ABC transporter with duplicated ATPase domains
MATRQAVLGMERASFFYGSARVFGGVTFLLDGARTALVGENGTGKSTLLKCLTGELELNGGKVIRSRGLRTGSVPQDVPAGLADLAVRDVLQRSLAKVGLGDDWWRIDVLLDEIGVEQEILDKPFDTLSGGWQRLLLIAAAARLEEPDILILDEPTNHLDLANINTLERWLTVDFPVPMLIVSHDREFLNRVTERTLFLRSDGMHALPASAMHARSCCAATRRRRRARSSRKRRSAAWSRPRRATRCGRSRIPTSTSARPRSKRASPASRRTAPRPMSRANGGWSSPMATWMPGWHCASPASTSWRRAASAS